MSNNGWIGVDLDATLAHYDGWKGIEHIGVPIPAMKERVLRWISEGKRVKIFTARANTPEAIPHIEIWLMAHGFPKLEVTSVKDFGMIELWDDRCIQVEPNMGIPVMDLAVRSTRSRESVKESHTDAMNRAIRYMHANGPLVRKPGGYWQKEGVLDISAEHFGTNTVEGLVARKACHWTEWATPKGRNRHHAAKSYPIKCEILRGPRIV